jgi:cytochrome c5
MQKKICFLFLTVLVIGVLAGCNSATPPAQPPAGQPTAPAQATANPAATSAPAADGASLVESRCTVCHALDRVKSAKKTKDQWTATVAKMISNGAKLTPAEQTIVIDYLSKTYP